MTFKPRLKENQVLIACPFCYYRFVHTKGGRGEARHSNERLVWHLTQQCHSRGLWS